MSTDDRRAYALAHPAVDPAEILRPAYARREQLPDGNLLQSILAVDR